MKRSAKVSTPELSWSTSQCRLAMRKILTLWKSFFLGIFRVLQKYIPCGNKDGLEGRQSRSSSIQARERAGKEAQWASLSWVLRPERRLFCGRSLQRGGQKDFNVKRSNAKCYVKNDRRNSGGALRQKFNHIDFRHLTFNQWSNGPRDQWTNGPIDQWTNEPMVQWNIGPINDLDDLEDIPKISQRYPKVIPKISSRYHSRYPQDIPEISQRYLQDIPKISPWYPQDIPKISPRYPLDIPKISPRYPQDITQDIPKISPRNPQDILKIFPRYPQDILKRSPRYPWDIS